MYLSVRAWPQNLLFCCWCVFRRVNVPGKTLEPNLRHLSTSVSQQFIMAKKATQAHIACIDSPMLQSSPRKEFWTRPSSGTFSTQSSAAAPSFFLQNSKDWPDQKLWMGSTKFSGGRSLTFFSPHMRLAAHVSWSQIERWPGNLRRAIQVYDFEYDLILNADYNTRSHTQWCPLPSLHSAAPLCCRALVS